MVRVNYPGAKRDLHLRQDSRQRFVTVLTVFYPVKVTLPILNLEIKPPVPKVCFSPFQP